MDSVSCRGDTSALTRAMSQPKSSAYNTLAMASLQQRRFGAGGPSAEGLGSGGSGVEDQDSPGIHGTLHRQGGEDLLSHCLLGRDETPE